MAIDENKKKMIKQIVEAMQAEGVYVYENPNITNEEKLSKMDVIADVIKFLSKYETNVRILSEYEYEHRMDKYKTKNNNGEERE